LAPPVVTRTTGSCEALADSSSTRFAPKKGTAKTL
jgi:hypothetical protein